MLDAAVWEISRNAEAGIPVPDSILRFVRTRPFNSAFVVRIFYTIDSDNECTLWWVHVDEAPETE